MALTASAKVIYDTLLNAAKTNVTFPWVSEPALMEATDTLGPSIRKVIQLLRKEGYCIPSAMYTDKNAFDGGARGWRLADFDSELTDGQLDAIHTNVITSIDELPINATVFHAQFGRGKLRFCSDNPFYTKVRVSFQHGDEKVEKSALSIRPIRL